jgi:hypothetical protein
MGLQALQDMIVEMGYSAKPSLTGFSRRISTQFRDSSDGLFLVVQNLV